MKQRLLETVARSARLKLLNELKRSSTGLPVKQLAERLGMSYMGVKDLCVDLHARGLLATWRQPQKLGRPLMLYRLTEKAHELYPAVSNALTIDLLGMTQRLYGAAAPEKLLMLLFHTRTEQYQAKLGDGPLEARAAALTRLRDAEGCMGELEKTPEGGLLIVEHHSPMLDVLEAFPIVGRLEAELFQHLLGVPVRREEDRVAGLFTARFHLGGGGEPPGVAH